MIIIEVKINKELRQYKETIYFGLTLRQFICAALAMGIAVAIYFLFADRLGTETVSWLCVLAAAPVAVAGFFKYQGMTFEKFVFAWFKSEFLCAGRRVYKATNMYVTLLNTDRRKPKIAKQLDTTI